MNVSIRKAVLGDVSALAQFNQNIAWETEKIELLPEVISSGVRRLIEDEGRGFYLVAEIAEEIAASLMITKEWSDWRNGEFWWIQSVYVETKWRRHGLYRSLYDHAKTLAESHGDVCGFRLYVEKENEIAQKTYENLGMSETDYFMYEALTPGLVFRR